jgi:hypothetical protein
MVFNVYFDPEVIEVAEANPPYGLQTLSYVLQGFVANCLLFDFEDERCRTEIGRRVNELKDSFDRKIVMTLLSSLVRRNRILSVMEPDYLSAKSNVDQALETAAKHFIQLVLTEQIPTAQIPAGIQCTSLAKYSRSTFESDRSKTATCGYVCSAGAMPAADFLDFHFANAFRHASRIEICDRLVGEKFSDSFEHTTRLFFAFLETVLYEPERCEIVIHCGESARNDHFCYMLSRFRGSRTSATRITVFFYSDPTGNSSQPHERYIWTDQFAFLIGRGMDFLDASSGRNRDVSIDLKNEGEIAQEIARYASFCVGTRVL